MALNDRGRSEAYILKDYKRIKKNSTSEDFSVGLINDNLHTWKVILMGPRDTPYESGIYKAEMVFPIEYPEAPPTFRFITPMWYPNIDKDGNVCISILHKAGEDEFGYEYLSERWLPVRTPESVILSVHVLLNSPNIESAFRIEVATQYKNDMKAYYKKIRDRAQKSLEE
jgi:ubiquitin-conjugating enzyme E2 G1